jgi:4-amino-4-deoxy-L-arabinose transferase-like glycosyltransferase
MSMNAFVSNWRRTLSLIFLLALLTRGAFIMTLQDGFYFPDSLQDSQTAVQLLSAGEFGADFGRAPGNPVLLAAVYLLFGESIFAVRVVESFMGAFLAVIIALLGKRVGGEIVGALAGLIWAFYPLGIFIAGVIYPTGLAAMLLACGVFCVLPHRHEELSAKGVFSGGSFFGLAALTIPVALLTIAVFAAWVFYWARHSRLFLAALFLLGSVVSLTPWTVRNFLVHGRLIPIQADFEKHVRKPIIITADGKIVFGDGTIVTPETNVRYDRLHSILYTLKLNAIRLGNNFAYFWELYPTRIAMSHPGYRERLHAQDSELIKETIYSPNLLVNAVCILSTGPILLFALFGTVAMWLRRVLRREISLLWIMALSFAVGYAFFVGKIRYRIPVEPYVIILSAYGIHAAYAMIAARFKSRLESSGSIISRRSTRPQPPKREFTRAKSPSSEL